MNCFIFPYMFFFGFIVICFCPFIIYRIYKCRSDLVFRVRDKATFMIFNFNLNSARTIDECEKLYDAFADYDSMVWDFKSWKFDSFYPGLKELYEGCCCVEGCNCKEVVKEITEIK